MSRRRNCSIRPDLPKSIRSAKARGDLRLPAAKCGRWTASASCAARKRPSASFATATRTFARCSPDCTSSFARRSSFGQRTQVDGVVLGDDLAWVAASRAHLKIWRSLFKPLFQEYCAVLHRHDKFVFFLCEGTSGEALDDLVEIGVDAVHAQWPHEEFEKHAARHRGRVTFWGGVERRKSSLPVNAATFARPFFAFARPWILGPGA